MNEILISAHSLRHAAFHHVLAVVTLYISMMVLDTHYDKVGPFDFDSIVQEIYYKICRRCADSSDTLTPAMSNSIIPKVLIFYGPVLSDFSL